MPQIFTSLNDPQLIKLLDEGAVGVLPTDTVYGLVCSARNKVSVERLYGLKSREKKPGTLIGASVEQIADLGIPKRYLNAVEHFWPGAVSVETPHDIEYLTQKTGRQAIRIPAHDELLGLLGQVGPLQTTSANHPTEPTARNIDEAKRYFGDSVDFYVDFGELGNRPPSTIIRVVDDAIEVIREGAVKIDEWGRIIQ